MAILLSAPECVLADGGRDLHVIIERVVEAAAAFAAFRVEALLLERRNNLGVVPAGDRVADVVDDGLRRRLVAGRAGRRAGDDERAALARLGAELEIGALAV